MWFGEKREEEREMASFDDGISRSSSFSSFDTSL